MENFYTIGTISKLCKIPTETLRYYDKVGLFCPQHRDEDTGYRYYTKESMSVLLTIRRLRNLGFSIEALKSAMENKSLSNLKDLLLARSKEYTRSIKLLESKKAACNAAFNRIKKGQEITDLYKDDIDEVDPEKLVKIEKYKPRYLFYSKKLMEKYVNSDVSLSRWLDIYEKCTEIGLEMTGSTVVIYHTEPLGQFLAQDCEVEFAVEVNKDALKKLSEENFRKVKSFTALTSYYVGDYRTIMKRHVQMIKWINEHDYELTGPVSEEFLISPLEVTTPENYVTKIVMPIEKKK